MKNKIALLLCLGFIAAVPAFADCGKRGCSMMGGGHGSYAAESGGCPIAGRALMKAHFLLENKTQLGLSEDQVKAIKAIKMDLKKQSLRDGAEMQIMMMDMESKLSEETVDVEGISAMIDKGSAQMAQIGKANVQAYAKLKAIPTKEQWAKLKQMKEAAEKEEEEEHEHQ
ncbi:MAG TPA: hypothetical protein VL404_05765 [Candidatus Eisenbacteria bacterium]|jgi:hypothetical protein|nr:hypothetical protein [Candidatus Eisenbacteria bacterium]